MPESLEAARRDLGSPTWTCGSSTSPSAGISTSAVSPATSAALTRRREDDHNLIAHALNETYRERGQDNPVRYRTT